MQIPKVWNILAKTEPVKVHFIAIGGSVMHQLAIALKRKGYQVTGSDDEIFEPASSNLAKEGLHPQHLGWHPELIDNQLDAIILGMHARNDNPELIKGKELNLPIYSFPEYIYQESRSKTRIVVGGSHGKTTTTAMIMHVLKAAGKDFDWLVGAKLEGFDQSVQITDAPLIVCEGDEYPASVIEKRPKFHFLFPQVAILTGIAWDHINVFPTFNNYLDQFRIFLEKIEPGGLLIYNETDTTLKSLVDAFSEPIHKIGYTIPVHSIRNGETHVQLGGKDGSLKIFGDHNLLNLNAAYLVCASLGVSAEDFLLAMFDFKGASKRLELLAKKRDRSIFRDFAHAPSKVRASIHAVKQQFPERKLIAVLELHTFSSLNKDFLKEYHGAMEEADLSLVFYSKHALELKKMPELPADLVREGFGKKGLEVINEKAALEDWLQKQSYENANLLLMSSGNYDGLDILTFARQLTG